MTARSTNTQAIRAVICRVDAMKFKDGNHPGPALGHGVQTAFAAIHFLYPIVRSRAHPVQMAVGGSYVEPTSARHTSDWLCRRVRKTARKQKEQHRRFRKTHYSFLLLTLNHYRTLLPIPTGISKSPAITISPDSITTGREGSLRGAGPETMSPEFLGSKTV